MSELGKRVSARQVQTITTQGQFLVGKKRFILLKLKRETFDSDIAKIMEARKLRPLTKDELAEFLEEHPQRPRNGIVIFGLRDNGPSDQGGFPGHVLIDPNGSVGLCEDWTRPGKDDDGVWPEGTEFLFALKKNA